VKNVARGLLILLLALLVACPQNPPLPPPGNSQFNIELRFLPGFPTQAKAFIQAKALFWEQVITGDIADVLGVTSSTACNFTFEQIPSPYILPPVTDVDDVVLYVGLMTTIVDPNHPGQSLSDGPGKTAAVANLCAWRTQGNNRNLPIISKIEFDPADLPNTSTPSQQLNLLADVTLHEMAHAFGFGTIWDLYPGLKLATPDDSNCGNNPQFTGLNAKHEYELLGGTGNIPLAASKERGTCGHWAEGMFEDEIMTPGTNPTAFNSLSRLTIASMADLGYSVSYVKADDYHLSRPEASTNYDIELVYDRGIDLKYRPYFLAAARRWVKVITGDIPDMYGIFDPKNGDCNIDHQSKFSGIDDIKIFVDLISDAQSDGLGGYTKRIDPCLTRVGSFLPAIGVMQYDPVDLANLYPLLTSQNPSDPDITASKATREITRDMGRVLGFGTNWIKKDLLINFNPDNNSNTLCENFHYIFAPGYVGVNALREYHSLSAQPVGDIPVIQKYFSGFSADLQCYTDWGFNEQSFYLEYELMGGNKSKPNSGLPSTPPALSKITIGAMQDLGYTVDYSVSDPYDVVIPPPPPPNPNCDPPRVTSGCLTSINTPQPVR
jgi:hypothetical protein